MCPLLGRAVGRAHARARPWPHRNAAADIAAADIAAADIAAVDIAGVDIAGVDITAADITAADTPYKRHARWASKWPHVPPASADAVTPLAQTPPLIRQRQSLLVPVSFLVAMGAETAACDACAAQPVGRDGGVDELRRHAARLRRARAPRAAPGAAQQPDGPLAHALPRLLRPQGRLRGRRSRAGPPCVAQRLAGGLCDACSHACFEAQPWLAGGLCSSC